MTPKTKPAAARHILAFCCCMITCSIVTAQTTISLKDLSFFKSPGPSWSVVSDVTAELNTAEAMTATPGSGILLNLPVNKNGADLYSNLEYGDVDLELDYMMSKTSNSGIYFQGRYEYQLLDSWLVKDPTSGDNGGIYERWDWKRPTGSMGYEGHAPRQNVSKAPGLWQHVKISFQAPRFDASGKKIENAKMLRVELNDVLIHENIDMQGPTRSGLEDGEKTIGPLRLQGDHGSVAFKNIRITSFDKPRPSLGNLKYTVYKGRYNPEKVISTLKSEAQGNTTIFSADAINNVPSEFFIKYSRTIKITEAGKYSFSVRVPGGRGILKINNSAENAAQKDFVELPSGDLPFELIYTKEEDWKNRALTLFISGPGIRRYFIGDPVTGDGGETDFIYVDAPTTTIMRSFINLYWGTRLVHAISVGSPEKIHYTYDLEYGALAQVWRGGFLDATPMWHDRGDGTADAVGAIQRFGKPTFLLSKLITPQSAWRTDTAGSSFRQKGYKLDKAGVPTFMYQLEGANVEDALTVSGEGQGFKRELTIKNAPAEFYARLADAASIEVKEDGMYIIDNKSYYLKFEDASGAKPVIREMGGRKELIVPVKDKLVYRIWF